MIIAKALEEPLLGLSYRCCSILWKSGLGANLKMTRQEIRFYGLKRLLIFYKLYFIESLRSRNEKTMTFQSPKQAP